MNAGECRSPDNNMSCPPDCRQHHPTPPDSLSIHDLPASRPYPNTNVTPPGSAACRSFA
ncbi:hypothetical protein P280DRAFT_472939 [Massarina eburnea CBS 473.64]|uniref:Uncharacterized protein n=1 Tax=Massarina eburnea CBS 473.64 TaxID=1395130 RepID=A0A6A6RMX9_9PLEO|nr:hypothetical protein P280DRAFT_472939 [Massarina eburnea CBS 473.64]